MTKYCVHVSTGLVSEGGGGHFEAHTFGGIIVGGSNAEK